MEKNQVWVPRNSDWVITTMEGMIEYYSEWCDDIQDLQFLSGTEIGVTYIPADSVCGEHSETQDYCQCESFDTFSGTLKEFWETRL